MFINKKINFDKITILNFLIALFPLTIIIGNLAININIILICFLGLTTYGGSLFIINNEVYKYFIYTFFIYLLVITIFNNYAHIGRNNLFLSNIIKSILFLRYLLIFLIVNKLMEKNNLNLKLFFKSCAFFSFVLSIDIIFQIIFKKDLIGNPITAYRPSGFFGNEHVAGSYLQKFILFFISLFCLKFQKKIKINLYVFVLFFLFFLIINSTGNRMPTVFFIFIFLLYFLLQKKIKYILIVPSVILFTFFLLIKFPIIERMDSQIKGFVDSTKTLFILAPKLFYNNNNGESVKWGSSGYIIHFNTGVQIWKKNKIFGHGLKSMPLNCIYGNNQTCNTHPHNYFIEIMLDTGIIGIITIYSLFLIGLFNYFKYLFTQNSKKFFYISFPIYAVIFFEFFPIKSSGSFFTTSNSIIIFLFLAIFLNYEKIKSNYKI